MEGQVWSASDWSIPWIPDPLLKPAWESSEARQAAHTTTMYCFISEYQQASPIFPFLSQVLAAAKMINCRCVSAINSFERHSIQPVLYMYSCFIVVMCATFIDCSFCSDV